MICHPLFLYYARMLLRLQLRVLVVGRHWQRIRTSVRRILHHQYRDHICTDMKDPTAVYDSVISACSSDTRSRNLYQKLAPNRTQLYSVQVSSTRNF